MQTTMAVWLYGKMVMQLMKHVFVLHDIKGYVVTIFGHMCQSICLMPKKVLAYNCLASGKLKDNMQQMNDIIPYSLS